MVRRMMPIGAADDRISPQSRAMARARPHRSCMRGVPLKHSPRTLSAFYLSFTELIDLSTNIICIRG
jgi:hypothetical protein